MLMDEKLNALRILNWINIRCENQLKRDRVEAVQMEDGQTFRLLVAADKLCRAVGRFIKVLSGKVNHI